MTQPNSPQIIMRHFVIALAAALVFTAPLHAQPVPGQTNQFPKGVRGLADNQKKPPSANWLLDADTDTERFRRLQIQGGGTDQQMWEVGQRYLSVYHAIDDENWELAEHHWGKIRDRLNVALMKRPNRTANAEGIFLEGSWGRFNDALKTKDASRIRESFLTQRQACMACHLAERHAFMNNQPLFRQTETFPKK